MQTYTPRGFTSLSTQETVYSLSGFVPTNKQTLVPDYLRNRPQYQPLSPSWTNSGPTPTCAPITRDQGSKSKLSTVVRYGGDLRPRPKRFSPSGFFLGFFFMGIGPCGPVPPSPLEWTSFPPLVTAVSITTKGAEWPGSRLIGVGLFSSIRDRLGPTFLSLAGPVVHWDIEK